MSEKRIIDERPSYKLRLHEKCYLIIDRMSIKSIEYNRMLLKIDNDYYGAQGLYYLTSYYCNILYTLEKDYKLLKLSDDILYRLKAYSLEYRPVFNFKERDEDLELFFYTSEIIPNYIKYLNKNKLWMKQDYWYYKRLKEEELNN